MNKQFYLFKLFRHLDYIFSFLLLFAGIGLTWFFFFNINIVSNSEKLIAGVISALGICLGIFQFSITQINNRKKRYFDLRYSFLQLLVQKIEMVAHILNENLTAKEIENPHGLVTKLMNTINEISVANNVHERFLFPGLKDEASAVELEGILFEILKKTDEYRIAIEKALPNETFSSLFYSQVIWHNDVKELLDNLHSVKYNYFNSIRKYF